MKTTNKNISSNLNNLIKTIYSLRSTKGCPWDRKQTSGSLSQFLLQETYEVLDAIDNNDDQNLKEELGDLLFQIIFQSVIKEEENKFNFNEVIININKKLKERHPHVFGKSERLKDAKSVEKKWSEMKKEESKVETEYIKKIPKALPSLSFAYSLIKKSIDLGVKYPESLFIKDKGLAELLEIQFNISQVLAKKNIDLENEYRKYLYKKQIDTITKMNNENV